MRRWPVWMLSMLLMGCSHLGNEFYCPPQPAFNAVGQKEKDKYQVDRECYKKMTKKQKACYKDAE